MRDLKTYLSVAPVLNTLWLGLEKMANTLGKMANTIVIVRIPLWIIGIGTASFFIGFGLGMFGLRVIFMENTKKKK
jgi:hypothetical protein|uniref:PsaJ n=1 Tax=Drosera rotundifolia TaxID=173423 RepID=A0A140E9T7_DRORT|nr:psaJ [Drosera rotundifolia]YP_009241308.1 psaJ [Drosera rotundifolia]AMK97300.1 PsaJ [Drosera rotundifolia]AMK97318.1 PsaJ [Drosera rotundifolia]